MLSSVLKSDVAIQVSILVARAFVAMRQFMALPKTDKLSILEQRIERLESYILESYIEEVMADMNDVNEDTRMQIELISESLAELQAADRRPKADRPRIGFRP